MNTEIEKVYAGGMEKPLMPQMGLIQRETRRFHSLSLWLAAASALSILLLLRDLVFCRQVCAQLGRRAHAAEAMLRRARDELEVRVEQRTADLTGANEQLSTRLRAHGGECEN